MTGEGGYLEDQKRMSFQCLTLESSFPYNLIESIITTFRASLQANFPGSQCQALG
ncbi:MULTISPECIES: hypothetical protein [unclassified Wolbachia]|uniref:hypothetical protein n=1 Tax=unclassified Wolbachia TaxID=2640676 RepID=UPI0012E9379C|nr:MULTISPECIES: hypothetical protein [unclassified Wolbachia]